MLELVFITAASLFAGFIDAIVGGGGLILTPALFAAYPAAPAATLFGTNKSASVWGSALAAHAYSRQISFNWRVVAPAIAACLIGAGLGAFSLLFVSSEGLRKALPFVLVFVLIYTLFNKNLGQAHAPRYKGSQEIFITSAIGLCIGFYDGFFGPGTGSFFVFALVRVLGYDFLAASAHAKLFNAATNLAALLLLSYKGHVWWHITAYLVVANLIGSFFGAKLAMKHGAGFVRWVFIAIVSALIAKTAYNAF
ncbi:MAG: TSUP family transporter [Cytophagales bacterium]|nr:TSUP family transporter [Cytophagales bacterium]